MGAPRKVTAKALRICVLVAAKRGIRPETLLAPFGIDMTTLEDVEARVPVEWVQHAWETAPKLTGDADFGLHAAELAASNPSHVVDYLGTVSRSPREFFELLIRFQRVLSTHNDIRLGVEGDVASLARHGDAATQFIVCVVAQFVLFVRRRARGGFPLRRATFRHARPESTAEYERVFGCDVAFEAPRDGIEFDAHLLELGLEGADPRLLSMIRRHGESLLAEVPTSDVRADEQVRRHVLGLPPGATPTIEDVARALGVSSRSLQRQLHVERKTFKGVVESARRDLALSFLRARQHSVSEVAFLTGFAEVSAFSRAFRRWMGTSPAEWRRTNLASVH